MLINDLNVMIMSNFQYSFHFDQGTMTISTDEVNEIVAFNQTLAVDGKPVNQRIVNDKKNVRLLIKNHLCIRNDLILQISGRVLTTLV
jgi:hypothetical protein